MDQAKRQALGDTAVDRKARYLLLRNLLPVGLTDHKPGNEEINKRT